MTTSTRPAPDLTAASPRLRTTAGLLLLATGAVVLLAIITAEALYPAAFDSTTNTVSDLAAMRPDDVVRQPSAAIFNVTMIVGGLAIAVAAVLLRRSRAALPGVVATAGLGVGMVLVGVFPGNTVMAVHQLVSLLAFTSGGLAAILTARLLPRALRPVQRLLGAVALFFLVAYQLFSQSALFEELGEGGTERWIVYPVALSLVVLGSSLVTAAGQRAREVSGMGAAGTARSATTP
jgi:hypothetical membrane protein